MLGFSSSMSSSSSSKIEPSILEKISSIVGIFSMRGMDSCILGRMFCTLERSWGRLKPMMVGPPGFFLVTISP